MHPRFHTPYVSILVFAALVWGFALSGEFKWNVTLSAVARLLYYARMLRRAAGAPAQAAGRRPLPLAGRKFLRRTGGADVRRAGDAVDLGQSLIVLATIALGC